MSEEMSRFHHALKHIRHANQQLRWVLLAGCRAPHFKTASSVPVLHEAIFSVNGLLQHTTAHQRTRGHVRHYCNEVADITATNLFI